MDTDTEYWYIFSFYTGKDSAWNHVSFTFFWQATRSILNCHPVYKKQDQKIFLLSGLMQDYRPDYVHKVHTVQQFTKIPNRVYADQEVKEFIKEIGVQKMHEDRKDHLEHNDKEIQVDQEDYEGHKDP